MDSRFDRSSRILHTGKRMGKLKRRHDAREKELARITSRDTAHMDRLSPDEFDSLLTGGALAQHLESGFLTTCLCSMRGRTRSLRQSSARTLKGGTVPGETPA